MTTENVPQPSPKVLVLPAAHRDFIVDPLIPTREIMLIAGGSGSGKSTFASQMMVDLQNGLPFFGRKVIRPPRVGYLAFDRSEHGIRRTFERAIGYEIPFPFYSAVTSREFRSHNSSAKLAISHFRSLHPEVNFLTVDGIGMAFKGEQNSIAAVAGFIHEMVADMHFAAAPFTLSALQHMAKTKKDAGYEKPREKLHGSVAWAATCETCIILDTDPKIKDDSARTVTLCPRQGAEVSYSYHFDDDGRLVPWDAEAELEKPNLQQIEFYGRVSQMDPGLYPTRTLYDLATQFEISESTAKRWIGTLLDEQTILFKGGHGKYEIRSAEGPKVHE